MTVWLGPDDVAQRLGIARRTALNLMNRMPHSVIGGTQRKRIRVSEASLDAWMVKNSSDPASETVTKTAGSRKKLERRK